MHLHITHRVGLVDVLELNHRTRLWIFHQSKCVLLCRSDFVNCLHDWSQLTKLLRLKFFSLRSFATLRLCEILTESMGATDGSGRSHAKAQRFARLPTASPASARCSAETRR